VSLLAVSTFPTPVLAQAADEDSADNPVIIVQARRRDEAIQDVPVVVQAVTAQQLTKLNIRNFEDVQSLVPGLSLARGPGGTATQSTLRGVAFDVNASGANGTVEFYLDDASVISNVLFQAMFDVGQIEVLRGPQGTLRGRASPSGSITVTSHRPDLTQAGGYLTGTVNDINGWNFNGALNVPIIADKLGIRIAGIISENDADRVRSLNNPMRPLDDTNGLRASVRAEPFDFLSLSFNYTTTDRHYTTFDQVESANLRDPTSPPAPFVIKGTDRLSVMTVPRPTRQQYRIYNWQAELRLFGQKLNYVGSASRLQYYAFAPADTGAFYNPSFSLQVRNAGQSTNTLTKTENHEIRISSDERIAGIFDYVAGYFWNKPHTHTDLLTDTLIFAAPPVNGPVNPLVAVQTPVVRNSLNLEKSFFGNITAHIGEGTEISGGIRRIRYHSEGALIISGVPVAAAAENRTFHTTIYQASVKHRFNESLMAYASFGTSWRPGSATNPIIFRDNVAPTPTLAGLYFPDAEKSTSYEIGIKSDWLDKRLRVNLTAFHQTFENFAYSSRGLFFGGTNTSGQNQVFVANPAIAVGVPAKVDGVEAEIQFQPIERWNIGVVAAYAKSKIRNGTIPCNDYSPVDGNPDTVSTQPTFAQLSTATGGKLVQFCKTNISAGTSAPFSTTVQSEYIHPLAANMDAYLRGLLTYNGHSKNDPTNAFDDVKAYAILNLYLGLRRPDGGWEFGVYGKNLFDTQRAVLAGSSVLTTPYRTLGGTFVGTTPWRSVTYTAPREFGFNFRVAFGSR
jgi:iron complex outermembrane receptor protein